jgi:hypothetical protein
MGVDGKRAGVLVGSALGLGIAADVLFQGRPLGLNMLLFAACFVAALAWVLHATRAPLHQGRRWMAAPLLVFSGLFAWHDSTLLTVANALALVGAVSLGALRRTQPRPEQASLVDYGAGVAAAGVAAIAGSIELLESDVPWSELRRLRGSRAAAVGRGVAIGLPFLAVFGGLFLAADAVFRRLAQSAVPNVLPHLLPHVVIALVAAWASAGLLRDLAAPREDARIVSADALVAKQPVLRVGGTEIAIALALIDLLFLAFVAVQARYLFGGRSVVLSHQHLTYAQYARHGFFELLAVSALVVPVVLAANAFARERVALVRLLSGVLIALELVVAASALQRMHVYVDRYGLTELRIYVTGVTLWIMAILAWAGVTVLRGRPGRFAVGALVAGFVATLALNVINPDALIVRVNVDRGRVDPMYLAHLSDDAVPGLVAKLPSLTPQAQREITRVLLARKFRNDPLGWNLARSRARGAVARLR